MHNSISSRENPQFKTWLSAKRGKGPLGDAYLLEGWRLAEDALREASQRRVEPLSVVLSEKAYREAGVEEKVTRWNLPYLVVSERLFAELTETVHPQGILLAVRPRPLSEWSLETAQRVLVAENLQDPGNLGTIWRSADAFGFDAIFLTDTSVQARNSKVLRAAMGSVFHLPVWRGGSIQEIYALLRQKGFTLLAAAPGGEVLVEGALPPVPVAVVIGNEGRGLSREAVEGADQVLAIPMAGDAESLNAAVAASIFCYVFRQGDTK